MLQNSLARTIATATELTAFYNITKKFLANDDALDVISLASIKAKLAELNSTNIKSQVITGIEILPTNQSQNTIITPNNNYNCINSLTATVKPLEDIQLELQPQTLNSTLVLTKNPDFSGINRLTITDIAIDPSLTYEFTKEDVNGVFEKGELNTRTLNFNTLNRFGIQKLDLKVPIAPVVTLKATADTVNCSFTPASIPADWYGEGGKAAQLGFYSVKLLVESTNLTYDKFLSVAKTIDTPILHKAESYTTRPLCFSSVSIPLPGTQTEIIDANRISPGIINNPINKKALFWTNNLISDATIKINDLGSSQAGRACSIGDIELKDLPEIKSFDLNFVGNILNACRKVGFTDSSKINSTNNFYNLKIKSAVDKFNFELTNIYTNNTAYDVAAGTGHANDFVSALTVQLPKVKDGSYSLSELIYLDNSLPKNYPFTSSVNSLGESTLIRSYYGIAKYANAKNSDATEYLLRSFDIQNTNIMEPSCTVDLSEITQYILDSTKPAKFNIRTDGYHAFFIDPIIENNPSYATSAINKTNNISKEIKNNTNIINASYDAFNPFLGDLTVTIQPETPVYYTNMIIAGADYYNWFAGDSVCGSCEYSCDCEFPTQFGYKFIHHPSNLLTDDQLWIEYCSLPEGKSHTNIEPGGYPYYPSYDIVNRVFLPQEDFPDYGKFQIQPFVNGSVEVSTNVTPIGAFDMYFRIEQYKTLQDLMACTNAHERVYCHFRSNLGAVSTSSAQPFYCPNCGQTLSSYYNIPDGNFHPLTFAPPCANSTEFFSTNSLIGSGDYFTAQTSSDDYCVKVYVTDSGIDQANYINTQPFDDDPKYQIYNVLYWDGVTFYE